MTKLQTNSSETTILVFLVLLFCCGTIFGQGSLVQTTAPPPLKVLASDDRAALEKTKDIKSRIKRTIELSEVHLLNAETHTAKEQFTEASAELGRYWALIDDAFRSLSPLNRDNTKTRDMYKRVEISLRAHGIRLTLIRRTTPHEFGVWIKQLEEYARNGRTEALNSFYGQTVVRENPKARNESTEEKRAADSTTPPEKQP